MYTRTISSKSTRPEAELLRAAGVEAPGQPATMRAIGLVGLAAHPADGVVAGDAAQRRDLLGDGRGHARHREERRSPSARGRGRGVEEEADGCARRGEPVPTSGETGNTAS